MLECPCVDKIRGHICRIRHPLAAIVIAGLAIHLLIMLLAMVYDSDYWAIVIRNINAGEGLYGMEGYYYTPVWGYILGLVSAFQNAFLSLGDSAVRVFDVIYFEASGHQTSATVTSHHFFSNAKAMVPLSSAYRKQNSFPYSPSIFSAYAGFP